MRRIRFRIAMLCLGIIGVVLSAPANAQAKPAPAGTIYLGGGCAAPGEDTGHDFYQAGNNTPVQIAASAGYGIAVWKGVVYTAAANYYYEGKTAHLLHSLGNGAYSATGIAIWNGTVYCSGDYSDPKSESRSIELPCYWENGAIRPLPLPPGGVQGQAYALTVVNGVLYLAGTYRISLGGNDTEGRPCYWLGTVCHPLPCDDNDSEAHCITVADGKVFTGGYIYGKKDYKWHPCYWEDERRVDLPMKYSDSIDIKSIHVEGGVVYSLTDEPHYWAGTEWRDIYDPNPNHDKTDLTKIILCTMINGTVYACGQYNVRPCYWVGEQRFDVPLPKGFLGGLKYLVIQ